MQFHELVFFMIMKMYSDPLPEQLGETIKVLSTYQDKQIIVFLTENIFLTKI